MLTLMDREEHFKGRSKAHTRVNCKGFVEKHDIILDVRASIAKDITEIEG